jgi:hydrogenase-4 component E
VRARGARAEDPLSADTVHTVIDDLGALLLFTMILIVAAGQIYRAIYAVAAQSLLIAIAAAVLATATGNADLWVIAGITLGVKAIVLPWVLHLVVQRMNVRREVEPVIPIAATLGLAVLIVVVSFQLSASLGPVRPAITGDALPVGIALTLTGVLVMATRKTALTQMVGLFASENGIFFTAMAVTQGMPLIIEIGVILDVILAALVMTILVLRVRSTVDADIADLDRLRG